MTNRLKVLSHFTSGIALAVLMGSVSAFAHEPRLLPASTGSGRLSGGFHVAPAFEDAANAVDVILASADGACTAPIDVGGTAGAPDPDKITLQVDALYLRRAVRPGGQLGETAPLGILASQKITDLYPLAGVFGSPGTYNSWFRPTHPGSPATGGAYGFHVYGTAHAGPKTPACGSLAARDVAIDHYFVCSVDGSVSPPKAFGCVEPVQPFPGRIEAGYKPNRIFVDRRDD
jgi:hypothetical protein